MNGRIKSAWLLASLVAVLLLQASPAAAKTTYIFGFEKGAKPFTDGSTGPATERSFGILKTENGCPSAYDTSHAYVKFVAQPGKASGAWLVAPFPAIGGRDLVRINFSHKSANICSGCKIVVYVGADLPVTLDKFQSAEPSYTDPAPVGDWINYQYPSPYVPETPVYNKGTIYVAIGVAAPSVKEATVEGFGLDCIELTIFPAP